MKKDWLIVSREGYYWKPNRCGYTSNEALAGLYTEGEARNQEDFGRGDKALHIESVRAKIEQIADGAEKMEDALGSEGRPYAARRALNSLMARVNRDGGHRAGSFKTIPEAAADAEQTVVNYLTIWDATLESVMQLAKNPDVAAAITREREKALVSVTCSGDPNTCQHGFCSFSRCLAPERDTA